MVPALFLYAKVKKTTVDLLQFFPLFAFSYQNSKMFENNETILIPKLYSRALLAPKVKWAVVGQSVKKCLDMDKWKLRIRKSKLHVCRAVGAPQILADTLTLFKTGGHAHHIITCLHGFQTFLRPWYDVIQWCRNRGARGATAPPSPPQYLADQLTLFHPGRADYPTYYYWHPQCFSPSGITGA